MLLNERILDESQIIETDKSKLPKGILARVLRTVCEFDVLNANKRKYSKELWERVLNDPKFKQKLENRQTLGEMEHPVDSQIKLDKNRTSHVVSDMYIDEKTNSVKAVFDLLPTEAGKFIHVLHEAGVKVTASLRADGELEEAIDEAGQKYQRVIPEAYRFITIDHTGDPSFSGTEPENILKTVKNGYESQRIERGVALALLESVNTEEAQELGKKIKEDKQHKGCKCGIGDKQCSGGCSRVNEQVKLANREKTIHVKNPKTGDVDEYKVELTIGYAHDDNYGADADGNRGTSKWFIEDIEIRSVYDVNKGIEVDVTKAIQDEVDNLDLTESMDEDRFPEEQEGEEKRDRREYDDAVQIDKPEQEKDNKDIDEGVDLVADVESKAEEFLLDNWGNFLSNEDAVDNLVKVFKVDKAEALKYVKKLVKGKGEIDSMDYKVANEQIEALKIKNSSLLENYSKDCISYASELSKLAEEIKHLNTFNSSLNEQLKEIILEKEELVENNRVLTLQRDSLDEQYREETLVSGKLHDKITGLQEQHLNEIKKIKEAHTSELIKTYVKTKTNGMGLKLHENVLTLLEGCKSKAEVDKEIRKVQDTLREGIVHYTGLKEIVVDMEQIPKDPKVERIQKTIGAAFEAFNGKA